MGTSIILVGFLVSVLLIAVVWRSASSRQSIPCPVWLRWLVELDNPFTKTNRAAFIVNTLSLSRGMVVLDAGCGPGRLTVPLAEGVGSCGRVVALDIQPGMLVRAKSKVAAAGFENVEFVAAGIGSGTLPRNHFDREVLVTVLGEIPNRQAALVELFEALKPDGVLAIVEVIFDPHFQSRSTVENLAASVGFRERAFFGHKLAYVVHFEKPNGG
ncbi:MAG: methyltransferase domain-containing protein [Sedimenticolaceae bacterium]